VDSAGRKSGNTYLTIMFLMKNYISLFNVMFVHQLFTVYLPHLNHSHFSY